MIGSPSVLGYAPAKAAIGGRAVDPRHPDVTCTVYYHLVKQPSTNRQTAVIRFLDIDNQNQPIFTPVTISGPANTLIEYDPTEILDKLFKIGYELVDNDYNPDGARQFFDADDSFTQTYIITLRHRHAQVFSQEPRKNIHPEQYQRNVKFIVQFSGAGSKTPQPVVQTAKWTRKVTADLVTGELMQAGEWQAAKMEYGAVPVLMVNGYHTRFKEVAARPVRDNDVIVKINYQPNGCMIIKVTLLANLKLRTRQILRARLRLLKSNRCLRLRVTILVKKR